MNMNQKGQAVAKNPNIILGCINSAGICKKHELVLLVSHQSTAEALCPVWGTSFQERYELLGKNPRRGARATEGLENMTCKGRLKAVGLFSLDRGKLGKCMISAQR